MHEMRSDAELFREICDSVSVKTVAFHTRMAANTIRAYYHGRINIPLGVWADVFALTRDPRIPLLLFARAPHFFGPIDNLPDMAVDSAALRSICEQMQRFTDMQSELVEIVADGRVDAADTNRVDEYNKLYAQHLAYSAAVHRGINNAYQRATAGRRS